MKRHARASLIIILTILSVAVPLSAQQITQIQLPAESVNPWHLAASDDGAVWLTVLDGNNVTRVAPDGTLTKFPLNEDFSKPYGIVTTPDGSVWFGSISRTWIKRIDSSGALGTLFMSGNTRGLCVAPSGAVYVTLPPDRIARITPTGDVVEFSLPFQSSPQGCAADKQGAIWYTAVNTNSIGRLYPDGVAIEYRFSTAESRFPESIVLGLDGNMWFTERRANRIGSITPSGVITEFNTTGSPTSITVGPDGHIWFAQDDNAFTTGTNDSALVRCSYAGEMKQYPIGATPLGITATSKAIWFTLPNPTNAVGKFILPLRRRAVRH